MVLLEKRDDETEAEYTEAEEGLAFTNGTTPGEDVSDTEPDDPQQASSGSQGIEWEDIMTKHWTEDSGRAISQNSPEFREMQRISGELCSWIAKNGLRVEEDVRMEKVTPDGGVRMRIISHGSTKTAIEPGMLITMQYTGYAEPDFVRPVDGSRYRGRREVYRYDQDEPFVHGMFLAIGKLSLGDCAHIRLTPEYGFGTVGIPPRIPPNSILHYVVEIREDEVSDRKASARFLRQPDDVKGALGFEVCYKAGFELREKGVGAFQKQRYDVALENFQSALFAITTCKQLLENPSEVVQDLMDKVVDLKLAVRRNCAVVHAKQQNWDNVKKMCAKILDVSPTDAKGIYYSALAYFYLGEQEEAMKQIQKGIRLHPKMPEYSELYKKLGNISDKQLETERLICKRMFENAHSASEDKWALVGKEVRDHVAEEMGKMVQNLNLVETPMKFGYFTDKTNLAYLKEQAENAGLGVSVSDGKRRLVVRLQRKAGAVG